MSCFQVAVLASGSKGNATVMRCEAGCAGNAEAGAPSR